MGTLWGGQCFTYFDEPRSRGADLKLGRKARAAVTIGPGMKKEKLMQAIGRMRRLAGIIFYMSCSR